jgi:Zn-dependent M28 family amino/carboxypeptidase
MIMGSGVNVVGRKLGSKPGQVVVAAHYDHIEGCSGADDNASGGGGDAGDRAIAGAAEL